MHAQDFMELHANKVPQAPGRMQHVASRRNEQGGGGESGRGRERERVGTLPSGAALVLCNNNEKNAQNKIIFSCCPGKS